MAKGRLLPLHHSTTKIIRSLALDLTRHSITSFRLLKQFEKADMKCRSWQEKEYYRGVNALRVRIRPTITRLALATLG